MVALGHTLFVTVYADPIHAITLSRTPPEAEPKRQQQCARYHMKCLRKLGYAVSAVL
jgi:hypothetical protein